MKGEIPLSVRADLAAVLPNATFTRGARRVVANAERSGVPSHEIAMHLITAGAKASSEGRSKIGPIGGQRVVFDRLTRHAQQTALLRRMGQ